MNNLHLIALLLLVSAHALPSESASMSFLREAKNGPIFRKDVTLMAPAKGSSLGPALKELQRRKRQLSDIVLPAYLDRLSRESQRYHSPFFRKRGSLPLSDFSGYPNDDYLRSYFSERRSDAIAPPTDSEEQFSSSELPEEALGLSLPTRRRHSNNNRTNPRPVDWPLPSSKSQFSFPSELGQKLFYQTVQRMRDKSEENELTYPQDWTKFDKDAYRMYLQSAINAFKEPDDESYLPALSKRNPLVRGKRSTNIDRLQEIGDKNETHVDRPQSDFENDAQLENVWNKGKEVGRAKRGYEEELSDGEEEPPLSEEAHDDFLTRQYFKQFAKSVGSKKKRFDQSIQTEKRTSGLEELLDNPTILHYAQEKLEKVEQDIMAEVEDELRGKMNGDQIDEERAKTLLASSLARLNALQNMKDSLHQLELLQQQDIVRKRAQDLSIGEMKRSELEKEKRRKTMSLLRDDFISNKKRNFEDSSLAGTKEECPVLDKLVRDCDRVLKMVEDDEKDFLELCLLHEVCYMSGALLGKSRHECDATLSSSLEATCYATDPNSDIGTGSVQCRKAAGSTYDALSNPSRYDEKGTIPYDPCVKDLLYQMRFA